MDEQDQAQQPFVEWGVASRPFPGEIESGDRHLVKPFPGGVLVAGLDGLGHGHEAAEASKVAVAVLETHAGESVTALLRRCHERLRYSRGVVMTLASITAKDSTMAWLGIGNVEGVLVREDAHLQPTRQCVLLRGGVVGEQLPSLRASVTTIGRGDTLVLATDGVAYGFADTLSPADRPQEIANRILATYSKNTDDALVLVLRCVGCAR